MRDSVGDSTRRQSALNIPGFDYRLQQKVAHSRQEWAALLSSVAFRRVEKGETFAHDSRGTLLFEVYANIQPSPTVEPDWLK